MKKNNIYHLQIFTPETIFFDEQVISIIAPGGAGYLGILADHAPLITTLKDGKLIITDKNEVKHFYKVTGGFLEVNKNEVSLLIDEIETAPPVNMGGGI